MGTIFPPDHLVLTHVNEIAPSPKTSSHRQQIPVVGRLQQMAQRVAYRAATAVGQSDIMRDEIRRIRIGRDRVDLQFDAVNTADVQPVDLKAAGMAVPGCQIERGFNSEKLGDQSTLGTGILIVDDELQRVMAAAAADHLLAEIETASGFDDVRAFLEHKEVIA